MPIPKDFPTKAEQMFNNYLYRCNLNPKKLPPVQYLELKKAFYGAIGTMMKLFFQPYTEEELFKVMEGLQRDTTNFWKEIGRLSDAVKNEKP